MLDAAGRPHGLTANSFTSVSAFPPLVLVCVDHRASAFAPFMEAGSFAINILASDQRGISSRFAGAADDRFEGVEWRRGELTGAPVLGGVLAWLECDMRDRIPAGDHTIFLGEVKAASSRGGAQPLLYYHRDYRLLGS